MRGEEVLEVRIVESQEDFIKIVAPASMKSIFFALDSSQHSLKHNLNKNKTHVLRLFVSKKHRVVEGGGGGDIFWRV